jgi:hypothetical protein
MTEILPLSHGYKAVVETDDDARNPWKDYGCQPPILVFNLDHSRLEDYGTGLSMRSILWEIPARCFGPKLRPEILQACGIEAQDCHYWLDRPIRKAKAEDWKNAIAEEITRNPDDPRGWTSARTFFEGLEFLCKLAKIPCKWEESTGYSQGDAAWVFVAATPEWRKEVGWRKHTPEEIDASLQADIDLWTAWAWGDVYGCAEVKRPDGSPTAIDHDSCWGYYGDDHEKSGLKEFAENVVECDIEWLAREAAAELDAACRDIATVA